MKTDLQHEWPMRFPPRPSPFQFVVGETYETQRGELVTVTDRTDIKGYECLECSDGKYRYDRSTSNGDAGRVTGTNHDYSCPDNFKREPQPLDPVSANTDKTRGYVRPEDSPLSPGDWLSEERKRLNALGLESGQHFVFHFERDPREDWWTSQRLIRHKKQ